MTCSLIQEIRVTGEIQLTFQFLIPLPRVIVQSGHPAVMNRRFKNECK